MDMNYFTTNRRLVTLALALTALLVVFLLFTS